MAGGITSNLLVPLYLVVAAGSLAWIVPELPASWRSPLRPGGRLAGDASGGWSTWVDRLLALVRSCSTPCRRSTRRTSRRRCRTWCSSTSRSRCSISCCEGCTWTPALVRRCLQLLAVLAVVFSVIGFAEYATKTIILNPKLVVANDLHTYFTVNSVFFDPDIFGRFLALVMVLLAVLLLYERAGARAADGDDRAGGPVGRTRADPVALEPGRPAGRSRPCWRRCAGRPRGRWWWRSWWSRWAPRRWRSRRPRSGSTRASTAPRAAAAAWSAAGCRCSPTGRCGATARGRS